jgi:hypothetical protein
MTAPAGPAKKERPKLRRKPIKKPPAAALPSEAMGVLRRILQDAVSSTGRHLREMTVLAVGNDPYRYDHEAGHLEGQWFAAQVERFVEPGADIHLRGLHYQLVSVGDVRKPLTQKGKGQKPGRGVGKVYRNIDDDWVWLQQRPANAARWLGYIDFQRIRDQRNAPPEDYTEQARFAEFTARILEAQPLDIELPDASYKGELMPMTSTDNGISPQPYRLVIIGEKSSLGDVLDPIAQRFNAELLLPTGESSTTMLWQMAYRAARDPRPTAVFYVTDFDPAGRQMPISAARKLQAMRDLKLPDLRVELHHICLTRDQCIEYDLPSTPLKETERRADKWRQIMGREQTEVDALQALRPDVLRQIVTAALEPFYDRTLAQRLRRAAVEWELTCRRALHGHPNYDQWSERIAEALERVNERMESVRAAMGPVEEAAEIVEQLRVEAHEDLSTVEFPAFDVPQATINLDTPEPLFTTEDDYITATRKLIVYKAMDEEGEDS